MAFAMVFAKDNVGVQGPKLVIVQKFACWSCPGCLGRRPAGQDSKLTGLKQVVARFNVESAS